MARRPNNREIDPLGALSPPLMVTGIGLATGLGGASAACAAARAGLTRPSELSFAVEDRQTFEMLPVMGRTCGDLTTGFAEVGLATRLLSLALADLFAGSPLAPAELERTHVSVNMGGDYYLRQVVEEQRKSSKEPEGAAAVDYFGAMRPLYASVIGKSFRALNLPAPPQDPESVSFGDQTGIVPLLAAAHRRLTEGSATACIVAGVDSLAEPTWLAALDALLLLKTPKRPVGLIPGEAAAALLVELKRPYGNSTPRPPLATISAIDMRGEKAGRFSETPTTGEVLASLIRNWGGAPTSDPVGLISDLNGDTVRASDFGSALVRIQPAVSISETVVPGISFGDTRAASAFLGTCVAVRAFARGYAPDAGFLVTAMNDDGGRGVVRVRRAE